MEKNKNKYQHTQKNKSAIYIFLIVLVFFRIIIAKTGFDPLLIYVMFFVLLIISSFFSLTVKIDEEKIFLNFRYNLFNKSFPLNKIISAKTVKNKWYYGNGIKFWFWPYMWIYSVSGSDAVEIKMVNGSIFRIGTDEPEKLEQVILEKIN